MNTVPLTACYFFPCSCGNVFSELHVKLRGEVSQRHLAIGIDRRASLRGHQAQVHRLHASPLGEFYTPNTSFHVLKLRFLLACHDRGPGTCGSHRFKHSLQVNYLASVGRLFESSPVFRCIKPSRPPSPPPPPVFLCYDKQVTRCFKFVSPLLAL